LVQRAKAEAEAASRFRPGHEQAHAAKSRLGPLCSNPSGPGNLRSLPCGFLRLESSGIESLFGIEDEQAEQADLF
jgi:hypothetical protein